MSTPLEPTPFGPYAETTPAAAPAPLDPDDPPWTFGAAVFTWLSSVVLMLVISLLVTVVYLLFAGVGAPGEINARLQSDPNVTLASLVSLIPTHVATLFIVWGVVTGYGRRPFREAVGWSWRWPLEPLASVGLALLLYIFSMVLVALTGSGAETELDAAIKSSTASRFLVSFLAVAGAPVVEELVYRGVLYPAARRTLGTAAAIVIVSSLFTVVHVAQYYNNPAVIAAVGLLGFTLTAVRAYTGRVLPCVVIHLVFNGVQVLLMTLQFFSPDAGGGAGGEAPGLLQFIPL